MTFILLFLYTWLDLWLAMVRWWNTAVVVDIKIRSRIEDNVNKSPGKVGEQPSNFPQSGIASNRGRKLHLPACLPLLSAAADVICKEFLNFYFNVLFSVPENCTAPADCLYMLDNYFWVEHELQSMLSHFFLQSLSKNPYSSTHRLSIDVIAYRYQAFFLFCWISRWW